MASRLQIVYIHGTSDDTGVLILYRIDNDHRGLQLCLRCLKDTQLRYCDGTTITMRDTQGLCVHNTLFWDAAGTNLGE